MMTWSNIARHLFLKVFPFLFFGLSVCFGVWKYISVNEPAKLGMQENANAHYEMAKTITNGLRKFPDSIPLHLAYYEVQNRLTKQEFLVFKHWENKHHGPVVSWVNVLKNHPKKQYVKAAYFNLLLRNHFEEELDSFPLEYFQTQRRNDELILATYAHITGSNSGKVMHLSQEKRMYPKNQMIAAFPFFKSETRLSKLLGVSSFWNWINDWRMKILLLLIGAALIRYVFMLDIFQSHQRITFYKIILTAIGVFGSLGYCLRLFIEFNLLGIFYSFLIFEVIQFVFIRYLSRRKDWDHSKWNSFSIITIVSIISACLLLISASVDSHVMHSAMLLPFLFFKMAASVFPSYWMAYEKKYKVPKVLLIIASHIIPGLTLFLWTGTTELIAHVFLLFLSLVVLNIWITMINNVLNRHPNFRVQYDAPTNFYKRSWISMLGIWVLAGVALQSLSQGVFIEMNQVLMHLGYGIPFYLLFVNMASRLQLSKNRKIPFQALRLEYHYDFREMKDKRLVIVPAIKGSKVKEPAIVGKVVNRILIGRNTEWLHVELYWPLSHEQRFYNHIAVKLAHPGHTYRRKNAVLAVRVLSFNPERHQHAIPADKTKSYGSALLKAMK